MNLATVIEDWDTSLVLTVFLAPFCVVLIGIIFTQMWSNNSLKNEKDLAITKRDELQKVIDKSSAEYAQRLGDACAEGDQKIQRQKEEIEQLDKELHDFAERLRLYQIDASKHDEIVGDLKAEIARLKTKITSNKIA